MIRYMKRENVRSFLIESVHCIGERKSELSKTQFKEAINKLAHNKELGERMQAPDL